MEERKEWIGFLRNRSNHLLVMIVTIGAGVIKLFMENKHDGWFATGTFIEIMLIVYYAIITIIEFKEIKELTKEVE